MNTEKERKWFTYWVSSSGGCFSGLAAGLGFGSLALRFARLLL